MNAIEVDLEAGDVGGPEPLIDEKYFVVDWTLPLDEQGQYFFFSRLFADFENVTKIIKAGAHARYRKPDDKRLSGA